MYFIASGEVEVDVKPNPVVLGEGDFFGELALIHQSPRNATIRALKQTSLLVLDADDFQVLVEEDSRMGDSIKRTASERKGNL